MKSHGICNFGTVSTFVLQKINVLCEKKLCINFTFDDINFKHSYILYILNKSLLYRKIKKCVRIQNCFCN